jgi:predicted MFS family arabinose efflux permease
VKPAAAASEPRRILGLGPEWILIAFLWGCYTLNYADRQVVYTLFPALQKEFGFSDAALGLTGALFLWTYGFCSPVAGLLGDRWSKTGLVAGSLAVWSTFTLLAGFAPTGLFLLACRALLGVSESLFMPAAYGLMANAHAPQSRSKAIAIFGTSQLFGVAIGGSMSGFIAERYYWRLSFWLLGGTGVLFALPLLRFLRTLPRSIREGTTPSATKPNAGALIDLLRIPSLRIVIFFQSCSNFGLFLVYTWLPTFLYDKFSIGMARAGVEASVYPQIGSLCGLLVGGALADRYFRIAHSARFWVIVAAFFAGAPCIFLIGKCPSVELTRIPVILFGFCSGMIFGNQAAAAFDVVPSSLRASAIGLLNLLGALVSGFAPFLGGLARRTIGVDQLMALTSTIYVFNTLLVLYAILRHFYRDHARAQEPSPVTDLH